MSDPSSGKSSLGSGGISQFSNPVRDWLRRVRRAARLGGRQLLRAPLVAAEEYRLRYELTACLKFKNAAPFLAEWLEFHLLVGFEHFYLYNNNSSDDYRASLEPYLRAGVVTFTEWPQFPAFPKADEDCIARHRHEARWIAFLDDDEFLFPTRTEDVRKILRSYERYPAVAVHWLMFGSSGHVQRPSGLVTESYLRRQEQVASAIKSIVNPRRIASSKSTHYWLYRDGELAVDEKKRSVKTSGSKEATADILRINHYWSKSLEDGKIKVAKGAVDQWAIENPRSMELWHETDKGLNAVEDRTILRFLPDLKKRLENRKSG